MEVSGATQCEETPRIKRLQDSSSSSSEDDDDDDEKKTNRKKKKSDLGGGGGGGGGASTTPAEDKVARIQYLVDKMERLKTFQRIRDCEDLVLEVEGGNLSVGAKIVVNPCCLTEEERDVLATPPEYQADGEGRGTGCWFLDAPSHLYKRLCPSVRRSVRPSVLCYFGR